jgi:YD repeat-containing protein
MRRCLTWALLLVAIGQSSGSAVASTSGQNEQAARGLMGALTSAVVGSQFYAALTGSSDRYAAMHEPPPRMEPPRIRIDAVRLLRAEHPLEPRRRFGIRRPAPPPPHVAFDLHHPVLDPLAMRRSTLPPKAPSPALFKLSGESATSTRPADQFSPVAVKSKSPSRHPIGSRRGGPANPLLSLVPTTGIEPWWAYEERAIPGIGKAMLNVGTGNLVVSAMDVDVPERDIDLAFQRVYNSQSQHDANGDDGGDPAIFGNGWTNNFDANIIYNSTYNTITVYNIDGAACPYTSNGNGTWTPCPGEYATLTPVAGSGDCSYNWTKKNGTVYVFHTDQSGLGCSIAQAKQGHLENIVARNAQNYLSFTYSYNGQGKSSEDVTEIDVTHSDGDVLTLLFGVVGPNNINELTSIIRPDGSTLAYLYDGSGNLLEVDKPGNNNNVNPPQGRKNWPQGDIPETYSYVTGTMTMQTACGPRCTVSTWANGTPSDGSLLLFNWTGLQLNYWQVHGVMNFVPGDGTGTALQPTSSYPTSFTTWYTATFVYGSGTACSTTGGSSTTTMCDSDGHGTIWTINGTQNVIQTQEFAESNLWILTSEGWDNNNDLLSTTDANNNVTQYNYDVAGVSNQGGNLVEMQSPAVNDIYNTNGQYNSLSFYSYDAYNNVTAYCDPVYNQTNGNQWTTSTSDQLCPKGGHSNYATFQFTPDSNETYGCLTQIAKPSGYSTTIGYGGGCGIGLPTVVMGQTISQFGTNPSRTPTQDLGYDGHGNLHTYDRGMSGGYTLDSWTLAYDQQNLNDIRTENDPTIQNAVMSSYTCHYPDGSVFYTETPSQHSEDSNPPCPSPTTLLANPNQSAPTYATSYQYDVDGDQTEIVDNKGCVGVPSACGTSKLTSCTGQGSNPIGTTCKYYDGLDKLVETAMPYDSRAFSGGKNYEYYSFRWMDRYIYDLTESSGSSTLTVSDVTGSTHKFAAYGNLYKTQELLPTGLGNMVGSFSDPNYPNIPGPSGPYAAGAWSDVRGTSFDALDRPVNKYELAYGTAAVTTNTYDATQYDLLSQTTNAMGQITTYTYDGMRRVETVSFGGTAPTADSRTYQYDADGRTASATGQSFGQISYTYDVDGNETSVTEPHKNSNYAGYSLICYANYPDGLREYLSIGDPTKDTCSSNIPYRGQSPSNGGINQQDLFSYAYTEDDRLATQLVTWGPIQIGSGTYINTFSWVYTPSGRESSETDPLYGQVITLPGGTGTTTIINKSYNYDQFGRVASLTFPEKYHGNPSNYIESAFSYDDDDELISYLVGGQNGVTRTLTLNARGEMLEDNNNSLLGGWAQGPTASANGVQVGDGDTGTPNQNAVQAPPTTLQFDVRSNMATCIPNPQWALNNTDTWALRPDAAGRQAYAHEDPSNACGFSIGAITTTFDSENHIYQTNFPWLVNNPAGLNDGLATVTWGPDGRHRIDALSPADPITETAHWDGDMLLFSTIGGAPFLYVGKNAIIDASGDIVVSDRDERGTQMTSHGQVPNPGPYYTGLTTGTVRNVYAYKQNKQLPISMSGGSCNIWYQQGGQEYFQTCPTTFSDTFAMTRADGYAMVGGLVQGARTYDNTSGQWLTPDPYVGDVHDPMSQKPFMWNNNNPVEWADPMGYDPFVIVDPRQAYGFGHMEIAVINPKTGKGNLWSQGPAHNGRLSDRQVITNHPVSMSTIRSLQAHGDRVVTEHTSTGQNNAMNAVAQSRQSTESSQQYNAASCNCDQFVQQVLGAADPFKASLMTGIPVPDYEILKDAGMSVIQQQQKKPTKPK